MFKHLCSSIIFSDSHNSSIQHNLNEVQLNWIFLSYHGIWILKVQILNYLGKKP